MARLLGFLALLLVAFTAGGPAAVARTYEAPGGHATVQVKGDALSRKQASALAIALESLAPRRVAVVVVDEAPDGLEALAEERFQALKLGRDDLAIAIATAPGQAAAHTGVALLAHGLDRAACAEVVAGTFPPHARAGRVDRGAEALAKALVAAGSPVRTARDNALPPWVAGLIMGTVLGLPVLIVLWIRYGKPIDPASLPSSGGSSSSAGALEQLMQRVRDQREAHDYHDH